MPFLIYLEEKTVFEPKLTHFSEPNRKSHFKQQMTYHLVVIGQIIAL